MTRCCFGMCSLLKCKILWFHSVLQRFFSSFLKLLFNFKYLFYSYNNYIDISHSFINIHKYLGMYDFNSLLKVFCPISTLSTFYQLVFHPNSPYFLHSIYNVSWRTHDSHQIDVETKKSDSRLVLRFWCEKM